MASVVDWGTIGGELQAQKKAFSKSNENGSNVDYLRMKDEGTYVFRPVGKTIRFYKAFVNRKPVTLDQEHKDEAVKLIAEHFDQEVRADLKFAMYVIDRADGKIKVFEGNEKMLAAIGSWAQLTGHQPTGQDGGDWTVKATGSGYAGNNPRRYETSFLRQAPLTEDEIDMLKKAKESLPKLEDLFKATPVDQVIDKLSGNNSKSESSNSKNSSGSDDVLDF